MNTLFKKYCCLLTLGFFLFQNFNKANAQSSDSTTIIRCHSNSSSDGTNSNSITINKFDSTGRLSNSVSHEYGMQYDMNGNLVFAFYYYDCNYFYDTNSDSSVCLNYENGNLTGTVSTANHYDSLSRLLETISYTNGIPGNRKRYQYDQASHVIFYANEYRNNSLWTNILTETHSYSLSGKLLSFVQLNNSSFDSTYMHKYYYDSNDSLNIIEDYNKKPWPQNLMYLSSMTERDFHSSGKLTEERFYSGDTTSLQFVSKKDYSYDTLSVNGKLFRVDYFNTNIIPVVQTSRDDYYYDTSGTFYTVYSVNCLSGNCYDTSGYYVITYSVDSLDYSYESYSAYLENNGLYSYHLSSDTHEVQDSSHHLTEYDDYSTNYPPPIYSEGTQDSYTFNAIGLMISHCHSRSGSHINNFTQCCNYDYANDSLPLSLILVADTLSFTCPHVPVAIEKIITGGQPPYSLSWNNVNIIDSTHTLSSANNAVTFQYILTVTDALSNSVSDSLTIHRYSVELSSPADTQLCFGESVLFNARPAMSPANYDYYFYSYNNSSAIQVQSNLLVPQQSGTYSFGIVLDNCLSDTVFSENYNLNIDHPAFNLGNDTILCVNSQAVIHAPPGFTDYIWSTGDSLQAINLNSSLADTLMITCMATDSVLCIAGDSIRVVYTICNGIENNAMMQIEVNYNALNHQLEIKNPSDKTINIEIFNSNVKLNLKAVIEPESFENIKFEKNPGIYFYDCVISNDIFKTGRFIITQN
jgi:hypothetical protein